MNPPTLERLPTSDLGGSPEQLVGPPCSIQVERAGPTLLITLLGELDAAAEHVLVDAADDHLDETCRDVIVSCEGLTFVDSHGLRCLLALRAACAGTDTRFHLVSTPQLDELLDITGLTTAFEKQ